MTSALIFLAEGAEEMELVITADVLRRAGVHISKPSCMQYVLPYHTF